MKYNTGINSKGKSIGRLLEPTPAGPPANNAKLVATLILCLPSAAISAAGQSTGAPGVKPAACNKICLREWSWPPM
jgi:hypothetical protein